MAFPPSWVLGKDGEIHLTWSTGFYGVKVRLTQLGEVWVGQAESFTDAHPIPAPPIPRTRVTAKRVTCPRGLSIGMH